MSENLSEPLLKEHLMKSLTIFVLVASLLTLTGCNTVKGVGQDLQKAGSAIEDAVKK
jgi:predicted small secreted protein